MRAKCSLCCVLRRIQMNKNSATNHMEQAASAAAAGNPPEVAFKAVVLSGRKKDGQSIHRFRGTFTWDQIVDVFGHLMSLPSRSIVIEYTDEDGDTVQVRSAMEWDECLRLHVAQRREAPLRITVRQTGGTPERMSPENCHECAESCEAAEGSPPPVPKLHFSRLNRSSTEQEAVEELTQDGHILLLLSLLFQCDAAKEIYDQNSLVDFGQCVERGVCPKTGEPCANVFSEVLRTSTIVEGQVLIEERLYQDALRLHQQLLRCFPQDATAMYLVAKCLSLNGNREGAIAMLAKALSCGFDDVERIMSDEDLTCIRDTEEFDALTRQHLHCFADDDEFVDAAPHSDANVPLADPTSMPLAPQNALDKGHGDSPQPRDAPNSAGGLDSELAKILSILPQLTPDEALDRLQRAGGDLKRAVMECLSTPRQSR